MKLFECQHCGQLLFFENTRSRPQCTLRLSFVAARQLCPDRLVRIGGCAR
ncbi:MAG: zinc-ribbon domain-containing protein [Caldilineaceae bacterium]|jgi:hypothetical protein